MNPAPPVTKILDMEFQLRSFRRHFNPAVRLSCFGERWALAHRFPCCCRRVCRETGGQESTGKCELLSVFADWVGSRFRAKRFPASNVARKRLPTPFAKSTKKALVVKKHGEGRRVWMGESSRCERRAVRGPSSNTPNGHISRRQHGTSRERIVEYVLLRDATSFNQQIAETRAFDSRTKANSRCLRYVWKRSTVRGLRTAIAAEAGSASSGDCLRGSKPKTPIIRGTSHRLAPHSKKPGGTCIIALP
jgi:hypothetical protein